MPLRLFTALARHAPTTIAISDVTGCYSYAALLSIASEIRHGLLRHASRGPRPACRRAGHVDPPRVALFTKPAHTFVAALLAAWAAPAAVVPLSPVYPANALRPLLQDADPVVVVTDQHCHSLLPPGCNVLRGDQRVGGLKGEMGNGYKELCREFGKEAQKIVRDAALLMYTSGTTGRSKGVVWTHDMVAYQTDMLKTAWRWSSQDVVLNVLPLHHIHGLVNVVLTGLYSGATIEMHETFDAKRVWDAFCREHGKRPTVFMGVPAVYGKLIAFYDCCDKGKQGAMSEAVAGMRLFVCGSAGLKKSDFERWAELSGQKILERYGMTEAGMMLSNAYEDRRQGLLGNPLPGVEVKIDGGGEMGRLLVKGRGVFKEYWRLPEKTKDTFKDGWMDTGDVVVREQGGFRMMGRASADIIKTGGYKVSAIEIEEVIREYPAVEDCSVVGIEDDVLGECIVAAVIGKEKELIEVENILRFVKEMLPMYKVPRRVVVMDEFPRNVLGKVQKKLLRNKLQ